jgi:hypothetical protein
MLRKSYCITTEYSGGGLKKKIGGVGKDIDRIGFLH